MKQTIEIEVDVPEGFEATGEHREPKEKEWYLLSDGRARLATWDYTHFKEGKYLILRRVEPKKQSRWIVGWRSCTSVNRAQLLTDASGCDSAAIIRIDYENGVPVSVALESVEQPLTPSAPPKE